MNTSEKLERGFVKVAKEGGFGDIGDRVWNALKKDKYLRNTLGGATLGGLSSYLTGADGLTSALFGGLAGAGGTYAYDRYNDKQQVKANLEKLRKLKDQRQPDADKAWNDAFWNWETLYGGIPPYTAGKYLGWW